MAIPTYVWIVTWHDPSGTTDICGVGETDGAAKQIAAELLAEIEWAPSAWEDMAAGDRWPAGLKCARPFWRMRFADGCEMCIDRYEVMA